MYPVRCHVNSFCRQNLDTNYKSRPPITSSLQVQRPVKRLVFKRAHTLGSGRATTFLGQKFLKCPCPTPPIKNVPSLTENGKRMNIRKLLPCRHMQVPTHRVPRRYGSKGQMTSNINLDSRALLRMTARERRALGNPVPTTFVIGLQLEQ